MADKILVAYYSKTGHTKAAAQKIAKVPGKLCCHGCRCQMGTA